MIIVQSSDRECLTIPDEMGKPKAGQLVGSHRECIVEIAGRVCYDSLGKGRNSGEYHKHIHDSGHYSVQEHVTLTVLLEDPDLSVHAILANRPGIWIRTTRDGHRVTLNPRAVNDWDRHGDPGIDSLISKWAQETFCYHWMSVAPHLIRGDIDCEPTFHGSRVEPAGEDEVHVTCFMVGSRGFSHEQVRHRHRTAISQRSTRYVDESGSDWHWHPLLQQLIDVRGGANIEGDKVDALQRTCEETQAACEVAYNQIVELLEPYVRRTSGCDAHTARKQARGAARGFLGNALETEMLFTAPVSQWRWQFSQRLAEAADAEIRGIYAKLLPMFQSRGFLVDLEVREAADGLGVCLA